MLLFDAFRLDTVSEQIWRDRELIQLQPRAFALLRYFAERPQRLLTKRELVRAVWGPVAVVDGVLKAQLLAIRKALGDDAKTPKFIQTVHRRGYRFIVPVRDSAQQPAASPPVGGRSPRIFVGRCTELDHLSELVPQIAGGGRQFVFVTGEPGIGKTWLVNAFFESLQSRRDLWIARGQCIEQHGLGEAYLALLEAFGRLFQTDAATELIDLMARRAPTWLAQLPDFHTVQNFSAAGTMGGGAAPKRMLRELVDALELFTLTRPLVLVLEDLQWADASTLDALAYLARRSDPIRLLVLGTCRSLAGDGAKYQLNSLCSAIRTSGPCEELALQQLTAANLSEYLNSRFPQHDFPNELATRIHELSRGNPLFMSEILNSWVHRELLRECDGRWQLAAAAEALLAKVPETLCAMICDDIDRLAELESRVLAAASVMGTEFSSAALAVVLDADVVAVEALCMRWARQRRFITLRGKRVEIDGTATLDCEFIHAMYRQVIYQRLGPAQQALLHGRIGEWQAKLTGSSPRRNAAELALHFERGRDLPRAIRYHKMAGEQALRVYAYQTALEHFRKALELLDAEPASTDRFQLELELVVAFGVPLSVIRGYADEQVAATYERASILCDQLVGNRLSFPSLAGLATFYLVRGECLRSGQLAAQLAMLPRTGDGEAAEALNGLACASFYRGDLAAATTHFEQVLEIYRARGEDWVRSGCRYDPWISASAHLAVIWWIRGFPDRALHQAKGTLAMAKNTGEPFGIALALEFYGLIRQFRRESRAALETARELLALAECHGFEFFQLVGSLAMGVALVQAGDVQAGLNLLRQGWAAEQTSGAEIGITYWSAALAETCIELGEWHEASQILTKAFFSVVGGGSASGSPSSSVSMRNSRAPRPMV